VIVMIVVMGVRSGCHVCLPSAAPYRRASAI
jgi:hypothetical protein